MKTHKRYRIRIEDESRLEKIGEWTLSPRHIWGSCAHGLLCAIVIGFLVVLLTPLKQLIPGYYRPSQRAATEEAMLRVDSIRAAYERNNAYLSNILTVFDSERSVRTDTAEAGGTLNALTPDSLLPVSNEERKFNKMMQQREKFNISIVAPLAAEGMLFYPVCDEAIATSESRESEMVKLATPSRSALMAIADGAVIAAYGSPGDKGYSIVIQHSNGFASRYSGMGTLLVGQGDVITGGQTVGLSPDNPAGRPALIGVEMWHNGNPLAPYNYISGNSRI